MTQIRKAVFPVAGLGTRFLPATKSVPKEMLPLVDRPLIQYAVDEARAAGIEEFIFVNAPGKTALEAYFARDSGLEGALRASGKTALLDALSVADLPEARTRFVHQHRPLGLGHAIGLVAGLVGREPFAVLLPDDVIQADQPCLKQMIAAHAATGGNMVATMQVPRSRVSAYGVLDIDHRFGRVARARGLVEKPAAETAPSTQAIVGRYILQPSVMARLADQAPGAGGEIQVTDAIAADLVNTGLTGFDFAGTRYDCGSVPGFVEATLAFALARGDLEADTAAALAQGHGPQPCAGRAETG
jgi:UTP--glucose-1-phosphate uridylyltransferase